VGKSEGGTSKKKEAKDKETLCGEYKEWYASAKCKEYLKQNIVKSGIPLELRARKVLKDSGFSVSSARYLEQPGPNEGPGIWREIDIYAKRIEKTSFKMGDCEFAFGTIILGECKYSSEKDIFVFEHLERENVDLNRFPVLVSGHDLVPSGLAKCFQLATIAERVVEIDVNSASKEKGNFTDRETHGACEQLLPGIMHYLGRSREAISDFYNTYAKAPTIREIWNQWLSGENRVYRHSRNVPDKLIIDFLASSALARQIVGDFRSPTIYMMIPIIVVDETRGVIKVNVDESYKVIGFDDIGKCVYLYVSEKAEKYDSVLENSFTLPILISNLAHLHETIKIITDGVGEVIKEVQQWLADRDYLIAKEMLLNGRVQINATPFPRIS